MTDHPIFSVFAGERNSFSEHGDDRPLLRRRQRIGLPEPDSTTQVIARLRNKAPLVVEQPVRRRPRRGVPDEGLAARDPLGSWNNWGRNNPSFVVAMLEMQSYLSAARHPDTDALVGTPLAVPLDVRALFAAGPIHSAARAGRRRACRSTPRRREARAHAAMLSDTDASGVYEAQLTTTDGSAAGRAFRPQRRAGRRRPEEARRDATGRPARRRALRIPRGAATSTTTPGSWPASNLGDSLLVILIAILLAEQVLAYACSYHPRAKEGRA